MVKLPAILEPARDGAGELAGAPVEIGAGGADDGEAGVLRDHQAGERILRPSAVSIGRSAEMKNGVP